MKLVVAFIVGAASLLTVVPATTVIPGAESAGMLLLGTCLLSAGLFRRRHTR